MQEEENGVVVSEQGCVSEKEVKKGEKMKIVGMTEMKTRKELVKRRARKCICKQRKRATQKKSGMRRGVLWIQEAAFTKRKEGEDEEKSSESVNTSLVVRENRECKDKKNMKENGESDVEDGPGSSKRIRMENYLFTGEQEETRKMENEIYSKDDNPNSYKRNGDRSKENSGLRREKREEGGEVEDVGSCERSEKDTNKDLEMNIQGTGAERNKDGLSGEGRDDRSDEKKNEGEGRNMEIKEYMNKVVNKENGDVWMAVLKENRDKQEEKVRKGQRLCGEEEDYKTRVKENEFGRKISEAEEGKEGTKETKADQCEMITDKSKEEYEEHADNEILEENKDKGPNVCNDVRGDEDKEECKENAEKDILGGNMDKDCNVQSDVRGNYGKEEYEEHADTDTREENLGKEPDVQSNVTGDESKEKNKGEEAKMTDEEENNKLVSLKTSFQTDGLNKDKKDEDEITAVKGSGEETYSNLSEKQGELAEQVKMAEIEVKGEGQGSETNMSLLESAKNRHQPSTWSDMPPSTEVALVELTKGSQEYKSVISKVELSFIDRYGPQKVARVQNPYLWGCYLLRKAECMERSSHPVTEKVLFHTTGQSNIDSITKNNLDWRRSVRTKYGCGVSFSPFATYANTWCNWRIGSRRALVIARVLVGRSSSGGYSTVLPGEGYDTTDGNCGQVYVKYCDHEFYPEYVMYYSNE